MKGACLVRLTTRLAAAGGLLLLALPAGGQTGDDEHTDAGVPQTAASAEPVPTVPADPRTAQVRALLAGTLEVKVSPQSLFEIPLDDEAALQIEATRIRALLRAVDEAARVTTPAPRSRGARPVVEAPDAGGLRAELTKLDTELWNQRLELDRARLEFYEQTRDWRAEMLGAHARRQAEARPKETEEQRRAREAEAERARALEAARVARSEAERAISEELARLIALESRIEEYRDQLGKVREELAVVRETVLGWQRRARDAKSEGASEADSTYESLRRALRGFRDELMLAQRVLRDSVTHIPALGSDPLKDIPSEISTQEVKQRRAQITRAIAEVRGIELMLQEERAATLLDEIDVLNRERLALLPYLSAARRQAITGFAAAGWDQARSEVRHLELILRHHAHVLNRWVSAAKAGRFVTWRHAIAALLPVLLLVGFLWARSRLQSLLKWGEQRLEARDRVERRTKPSVGLRGIRSLQKLHRPLEALAFFACLYWLVPRPARGLLEVQLIVSVVVWSLVGSLIIHAVNALAAVGGGVQVTPEDAKTGELRLRSLRAVGRTVIAFALILVLSARLVGEGTVYSWVFSTCWFAAIPLFFWLVRLWQEVVFERTERSRRKTALQSWILENRSGYKSFIAAMVGAVQLFLSGTSRLFRAWVSGFDLVRRIHAYLFKRQIERLGEGPARAALLPLEAEAVKILSPEWFSAEWLKCPADLLCDAMVARASTRPGALIAVVGPRGMGKSSLLRAVAARVHGAKLVDCVSPGQALDGWGEGEAAPSLLLFDDVHTLIETRIGGLAKIDELLAFARVHSQQTSFFFAIDAAIWPLLKRARDARPLFDEIHELLPWGERQLGALIAERSGMAGIVPQYDTLLEGQLPGADEFDREDALEAKRMGYERMLWDHVGGNPGLALEAWRASLGRDGAGLVHVRPLQVPDASGLERLPDTSLFVLRAVLQMGPAQAASVAHATRLREDEVLQEFRFGEARGYYEVDASQARVAWPWLRAVTRLLQRRHLLVSR